MGLGSKAGRVLLVRPNVAPTRFSRGEDKTTEHLGLGYLAAYLERGGIGVDLCDTAFVPGSQRDALRGVRSARYPLVGVSVPSQDAILGVIRLVKAVKRARPETHVCLGGHFATATHDLLLRDFACVDSVVRGEGERPLSELARRVLGGRGLGGVRGVTHRLNGRIVAEAPAEPVADLDSLPFPRRDILPPPDDGLRHASVLSSRGCQYACSFCSISTFYGGAHWRPRSIGNIVDEMAELYRREGVTGFNLVDDNFVRPGRAGQARVKEFCDELAARGMTDLTLAAMLAPACVAEPAVGLLYGAGLQSVLVGLESGSAASLRRLHKATTPAINRRALAILRKYSITITAGTIMFEPDTSLADLRANIAFLKPHADWVLFDPLNRLRLYAGTPVYHEMAARGRLRGTYIRPDYEFSDDRVAWVHTVAIQLMEEWKDRVLEWSLGIHRDSRRLHHTYRRLRRLQMQALILEVMESLVDFASGQGRLPSPEDAVARFAPATDAAFGHLIAPLGKEALKAITEVASRRRE